MTGPRVPEKEGFVELLPHYIKHLSKVGMYL